MSDANSSPSYDALSGKKRRVLEFSDLNEPGAARNSQPPVCKKALDGFKMLVDEIELLRQSLQDADGANNILLQERDEALARVRMLEDDLKNAQLMVEGLANELNEERWTADGLANELNEERLTAQVLADHVRYGGRNQDDDATERLAIQFNDAELTVEGLVIQARQEAERPEHQVDGRTERLENQIKEAKLEVEGLAILVRQEAKRVEKQLDDDAQMEAETAENQLDDAQMEAERVENQLDDAQSTGKAEVGSPRVAVSDAKSTGKAGVGSPRCVKPRKIFQKFMFKDWRVMFISWVVAKKGVENAFSTVQTEYTADDLQSAIENMSVPVGCKTKPVPVTKVYEAIADPGMKEVLVRLWKSVRKSPRKQ